MFMRFQKKAITLFWPRDNKTTAKLDVSSKFIGIPAGRSSYLVFVFEKSGFFSAETSTTYNTLIRPCNGYQYIAEVSYQENIYNVIINELDPGNR